MYEFTIKHHGVEEMSVMNKGSFRPTLGRFDLSKSMKPVQGFEKMVNWMKKAPYIYLPLFALPNAAFAMEAPPGFENFSPIQEDGFLQNLVTVNKDCILFVEQLLNQIGISGCSVGLSIFIWAAFLKLLTTPLYEKTLKYPAEFEKAVQSVIEK